MDVLEGAKKGDDGAQTHTLMNLVMQFRKVCNHPDLFERADTRSPFSFASFADTISFMREGQNVNLCYSTRNRIEYHVQRLISREERLAIPGDNSKASFENRYLNCLTYIWTSDYIEVSVKSDVKTPFSWLLLTGESPNDLVSAFDGTLIERIIHEATKNTNA